MSSPAVRYGQASTDLANDRPMVRVTLDKDKARLRIRQLTQELNLLLETHPDLREHARVKTYHLPPSLRRDPSAVAEFLRQKEAQSETPVEIKYREETQ